MAARPRARSVTRKRYHHANEGQGQRQDYYQRVPQAPQGRHHDEVDKDDTDGHGGEDGLEAFRNICEDAAAVHGDSRRQVQLRNLLVHQDTHRLRIFRDDIRNDACRPTSVRAADRHGPFPQNRIGQLTEESRPTRSNNYERTQAGRRCR